MRQQEVAVVYITVLVVWVGISEGGDTFLARCRMDMDCDDSRQIQETFEKTVQVTARTTPGGLLNTNISDACVTVFGTPAGYCASLSPRCGAAKVKMSFTSCELRGTYRQIPVTVQCSQACPSTMR